MAEFSGKIISAQYIDAEYSIIKVVYDDNGVPTVWNVDVNPEHPDYQDLVAEGWDQERIIEETSEIKKAQSAAFNMEVNAAAKGIAEDMANEIAKRMVEEKMRQIELKAGLREANYVSLDAAVSSKVENSDLEKIMANNENKDVLFKFKLWILDQDFCKNSTKEQKTQIRRATRATELFGIIDKLL